eukprot:jgi/Psemu1/259648/estExt_Genewise1Plus.C_3680004
MHVHNDAINFGIPLRGSVADFSAKTHGTENWKTVVLKFLGQKWVEMALLSLLMADVLIIFAELFLHAEFPTCNMVKRDCVACCKDSLDGVDPGSEVRRWLAGTASSGNDHGGDCDYGYEDSGEAECDPHKWEAVHVAEEVLFYITVGILCIFFIENLLEMSALGVCKFFQQVFLALDFVVVTVSLVMELLLHLLHSQLAEMAGLLIFFRLWRFVRIGHGIVEATHAKYQCLVDYTMECEAKLEKLGVAPPEKSEEVKEMMHKEEH